jgi:hypothetical protein
MPTWKNNRWPEGVPRFITRYEKSLFSVLNESARDDPNQPYTVFNGASCSFAVGGFTVYPRDVERTQSGAWDFGQTIRRGRMPCCETG